MRHRTIVESRGDRMAMVEDAGYGSVSPLSVLAGTLVAYGCFAVLFAVVAGIAAAVGSTTELGIGDWETAGMGAGIVAACTMFVAYCFGGYTAGRMARRAGMGHGLLVFLTAIAIAAVAGAFVRAAAGSDTIVSSLRDLGVPTSGAEWRDVGIVTAAASLVAMLLGSLLGGTLGERWHGKLLARALDPEIGAEADARTRADVAGRDADERHTGATDRVRRARGDILPHEVDGDGNGRGWFGRRSRDDESIDLRRRVDDVTTPVGDDERVSVGRHLSPSERVERARQDLTDDGDRRSW